MTIPSTASEVAYAGDGITTVLPVPFVFDTSADLLVKQQVAGVISTITTGFTISGGGGGNGQVTFLVAPPTGTSTWIFDNPAVTQPTDYIDNDAFPAESHERALDRVTRIVKRLTQQVGRTVRFPDADSQTNGELGDIDTRKGKYLFFDAVTGAVTYALSIVGTTLNQLVYNAFLADSDPYKRTAAEIAAAVTPSDYSHRPYNRARYASWANWKSACDQAEQEGVVDGDWTLTADIELPKYCKFTGGELTGAFTVLYQQRQNGWIYGLRCNDVFLRGLYFCLIESLYCNTAVFDGLSGGVGSFWNEFVACRFDEQLTVDISSSAGVNLNAFRGGRTGYLLITGTGSGGHDNTWDGVDFTAAGNPNSGILQNDSQMQVNHLRSCYFEGGATWRGNFHVVGYQGDDEHMPPISRFAHILCSVGINPRLSRDFFSASPINAARGGNWDILDSTGKPPALAQSGGAGVAVAADTTEPSGIGLRYEGTFSAAFSQFSITIQPTGSELFGLLLYYKSTAGFETISSNDPAVTSYTPEPVSLASDWKLLRISGPANLTTTTTVTFFAYGAVGGAAKFMAIGGFFANGERACMAPSKPATRFRYGSATYDPPSLADGAGVTTTVAVAGAAFGSICSEAFGADLQGIITRSYVSATDTVSVRLQNEAGSTIDLASATLRVQLQEPYA